MKTAIRQKAEKLLSSAYLRRTDPRIAILSILLTTHKPATQDYIAEKLAGDAPDKVTIYRTLESLIEAGLVHKVFLQERAWRFELSDNCTKKQCHPHFTCTNCGGTHCMTGISLPLAKNPPKGFIVHHQSVQLEGLCPRCNPKR
jgi:Fur family ferric uptake transcriptional regulator